MLEANYHTGRNIFGQIPLGPKGFRVLIGFAVFASNMQNPGCDKSRLHMCMYLSEFWCDMLACCYYLPLVSMVTQQEGNIMLNDMSVDEVLLNSILVSNQYM